jgi:MinD-like ATPase involved in chromosome partitioning or flagellar assembly
MTLICFASQKGSPGTTATALAVAASLDVRDGRRKLLMEADSTGGTLAIRYQLPVEPGLLTLAAAARAGLTSADLWRHTRELPGGLPVIVCPDGPEQVNAAMAASGARLGRFLSELRDVDVICDVGRLAPESPALAFVAEASALLMVARPTAEQLQPAARRMIMLKEQVANVGWVLVGDKPYGPAEVEATYDFPVVGVMADDPRSVASFESGVVTKRLRRHPFIRSATTLATTLSQWLAPITEAHGPAAATDGPSTEPRPVPPVPAPSALPSAPPPSPTPSEAAAPARQRPDPPDPPTSAPMPADPDAPGPAPAPSPSSFPSPASPDMDLGPQVSLEPAPWTRSLRSSGPGPVPNDAPNPGPGGASNASAESASGDSGESVVLQPAVFRQRRPETEPLRTSSAPPNFRPPPLDGVPTPGRRTVPGAADADGPDDPEPGGLAPGPPPLDTEPDEDGPDSDRLVG